MKGGITFGALTGKFYVAETAGQGDTTQGTTPDLVKSRHLRGLGAFAQAFWLGSSFFPLAGTVLVAVLSILLAHACPGMDRGKEPDSPSLLQLSTRIFQTRDIDSVASRIDAANDALFVDEKGVSPCNSSFLVEHTIQSADVLFPVAQ